MDSQDIVSSDKFALVVSTTGIEKESAQSLWQFFDGFFAQVEKWKKATDGLVVTDIKQKREMKLARESRLGLRAVRLEVENLRKSLKEDSLRRGKAIDGFANILKAEIEPLEARLLEQEKFAERYEAEQKRILKEQRVAELSAYVANVGLYPLGDMSEEDWSTLLENSRLAHAAKLDAERREQEARIEAERILAERRRVEAEEAAKKEAERLAREKAQAEENARLRREAEEREAAARAERERVEAERAKERAELAKVEAEKKAAEKRAEDERKAAEAKLAAERRAAEAALEAERAKARAEAEAREAAAQEAIRKAEEAAKPTRAKYQQLVAALEEIASGTDDPSGVALRALEAVGLTTKSKAA